MARPLPVLINHGGGKAASLGDSLCGDIEAAFAGSGRTIQLELIDGNEIADAVGRHADAPLIVVGGRLMEERQRNIQAGDAACHVRGLRRGRGSRGARRPRRGPWAP